MPTVPKDGQKPVGLLNPIRKLTVRMSLATGATVAALFGAQTLAFMEAPKTVDDTPLTPQGVVQSATQPPQPTASATMLPSATTMPSATPASSNMAPKIIIVRNVGTLATKTLVPYAPAPVRQNTAAPAQQNATPSNQQNAGQQAPVAAQPAAPAAVAPAPAQPNPTTKSSY